MINAIDKVKTDFSQYLYKEQSTSVLIPRQRNLTFLYDPKEDLIIAVSCHEYAIKLMREFLQFNLQKTFLFATVYKDSFIPKEDFMFYSISSRDFEWEDPEGYCLNPEIVYTRKSDKDALKTFINNIVTIEKAKYLIEKCHWLNGIRRFKLTANNYKEMIQQAYPDNQDVQLMVARQYEHDEEITDTEEYQKMYKSCIDIPEFTKKL